MAGFLRTHGVMVGVALSLLMAAVQAQGAVGAEPGHHAVGQERGSDAASAVADGNTVETGSREDLGACEHTNPIRMSTDGVALDAEERRPEKLHDTVLPQPEATEKPADMAMPRTEQAAAPADGPSASGSTSLAVSLLMCVGMSLLGLFVA